MKKEKYTLPRLFQNFYLFSFLFATSCIGGNISFSLTGKVADPQWSLDFIMTDSQRCGKIIYCNTEECKTDLKDWFKIVIIPNKSLKNFSQTPALPELFFVQNNMRWKWICPIAPKGPNGVLITTGFLTTCLENNGNTLLPGQFDVLIIYTILDFDISGFMQTNAVEKKVPRSIIFEQLKPTDHPPCTS